MMNEKRIDFHIGGIEDMGRRFVEAWRKAEAGRKQPRDHVTFVSLEAFLTAMSPKRLALMRYLRHGGAMSVRRLSQELGRDYKSVHRDVDILVAAGLIERLGPSEVGVNWDRAVTELDLAA